MELSRAEKLKRTRIANIMKQNPGMSLGEADQERIRLLKESGSRGGRATGESKIRGGADYYKRIGIIGGSKRGKNK